MSVPLKVKYFVWLVMRDRIAVMNRLQRPEVVQESRHIFVHCGRVYMVWVRVAKLWHMNYVGAQDVVRNLEVWFNMFPKGQKSCIWQVACIALVWSIWRMRNHVVFQRDVFDEERCSL